MVCPHCHVTIACRTDICPLCHARLNAANGDLQELRRLPRAFAPRGKNSILDTTLFDKVFLLVLACVSLVSLASELLISGELKFFWAILSSGLYLYFLIRATIKDTHYFSQKVVAQALVLTVLGFAFLGVMPDYRPLFAFEFILPIIYMVSMIMIAIYIILRFKSPRLYIMNLISVALLGVLPLIVLAIGRSVPNIAVLNPVMAIVTAIMGAVIIITTLIFSAKKIIAELKRKLHF